ncbi:MAG: VWA domain-containing protein [Lachnospiraceae bacterium]|nr:VWA domain-containing protein [Lachnospiraceae bacterium]
MQTILQVVIGLSPLLLVSLVFLIRRKMIVLPLVTTLTCLGVLVYGIFAWTDFETKEEKEKKVVSANDYLYLAESSLVNGELDRAQKYLDKMYEKMGDSPEGTLCNARLQVLKGDYAGAAVLYEKVQSMENGAALMSDADKDLLESVKNGKVMNQIQAAGKLAEIEMLKNSGADISEYGYSDDYITLLENSATISKDYQKDVLEALEDDMDKQASEDEDRYDAIEDALEAAVIVSAEYESYKNGGAYSEENMEDAYDDLREIHEEEPDVFAISDIDDAFVKAMVVLEEDKDLAAYAESTGSQKALVAVAQLVINGDVDDKDFSDDFVTITEDELKEVSEQCDEALSHLKDEENVEGAEYKDLKDKVENIDKLADYLVLTELDSRINPEEVDLEEQSQLYLGNSTINYATGNTDAGDENFGLSIDKSQYSDDDAYVEAFNKISQVVNDTADENDVKNVGTYIDDAYSSGIISRNETYEVDENGEEKETALDTIKQQGTTYVSKQTAMINISNIDISNFPEITFDFQTAEELDLDNLQLILNDCNVNIESFEITKNDYNSAKIYVVCDKSGSMEGSTDMLQEAVRDFANNMSSKEKIALVAFSDSVEFASELTDNPKDLEEYIVQLVASGGTNVASGAFYALEELKGSSDSFNVVILMTDGEDSSFYDSRLKEMAALCAETNTIVYTIGLGSAVQPEYLKNIAGYGGGKFVYCYNVAELEALYGFIHSQMENSYSIKFTALDTVTNYRELTLTNKADGTTVTKAYTLGLEDDNTNENGEFVLGDNKIRVDGFESKKIYKMDSDVKTSITGSGFAEDMTCSVSIKGDAYKGTLDAIYKSENRFEVVIPAQVPAGQYDVTIIIGGCAVNDKIEILLPGKLSTVQFGAYTFSAQRITTSDGVTTLSGDVSMNDFLHFYGDITLSGDIENDTKISLSDYNGYYISFTDKLPGLLGEMCGNNLGFLPIGSLYIYNDAANMKNLDNYTVEQFTVPTFGYGALIYKGSTVAIYPHKLSLVLGELCFDFPLQEQLFKYSGMENPFKLAVKAEGLINNSGVYVKGSASVSDLADEFNFSLFKFGLDEFSFEFDTYNHDYKLKLTVGSEDVVPSFAEDDEECAYGFDITFKGGRWDGFNIYADIPVVVLPEPPITLSGFFAGLGDLSSQPQCSSFGKVLWHSTFNGGCDISLFKVADMIPAVEPFLGDLSLLTLEETTISISLGNCKLGLKTTAKLFGEIECGSAELKLGKYDHYDYLLGIDEEVGGIYISVSQGPVLDTACLDISAQGTTSVAINDRVASLKTKGELDYDIAILGHWQNTIDGTFEMALVDCEQFVLIVRGSDLSNNKEAGVKIVIDGWDSYATLY